MASLWDSIKKLTADFQAESAALIESIGLIESDLTSPREIAWGDALPILASVFSYVGVIGYVMALSYLRGYNSAVLGNQQVSYGYLETIVGSWQTLLSAASILLGMTFGLVSLSLNLSSRTRVALKGSYRGAQSLLKTVAAIRAEYETWRPRILADVVRPATGGGDLKSLTPEEAAATLDEVGAIVDDLQRSADRHWRLMNAAARLEPATWMALRLAQSEHRNRVWAGLFTVEFLALLAVVFNAVGLSGAVPWFGRAAAGLIMFGLVMVSFGCFWVMASVADFAHGPGSRPAQAFILQIVFLAFVTALAVLAVMGLSDGIYAKAHPSDRFDRVLVKLTNGSEVYGFVVPVSGSADSFVLPGNGSTNAVVRVPAGQIESTRLVPRKAR